MRGGWAALFGGVLAMIVASTAAWSASPDQGSQDQGNQDLLKKVLPNSNAPVLLSADQVTYDQKKGVVTATGHVEISQNDKVLLADRVTYTESTRVMTADGNVALLDQDGNVMFADHMEL